MLDQITWERQAAYYAWDSFCRIRNFLKKYYVIFEKQIKHQKVYILRYLIDKNTKQKNPSFYRRILFIPFPFKATNKQSV